MSTSVCAGGGEERDPGDEPAEPCQPHPALRCLRVTARHHPGYGVVSLSILIHVAVTVPICQYNKNHTPRLSSLPLCFSVEGGELFDRIIDENYNLTELDTVLFIRQICEGLQYMHKMYILHLDLKVKQPRLRSPHCRLFSDIHTPVLVMRCTLFPTFFGWSNNLQSSSFQPENILCVSRATNKIKIIDFGLARRYKSSNSFTFLKCFHART